jgi:L-ascorbate metabolism protein UlaG (beta-lactamase superfamily)
MAAPFPLSDHCDGQRFFNPRRHEERTWRDILSWKLSGQPSPWPVRSAHPPRPTEPLAGQRLAATWIGHSTFLLQTPAGNLLTDPVYSDRVGPGGLIGPRRVQDPGVDFTDLPAIDVVLLSHDHYDHCDRATLRRLWQTHAPLGVTPLGNAPLLRSAGFAPERIVELDWWQSHTAAPGLELTLTPARHWSNRLRGPRNSRLWGGFHLKTPQACAYFAGDTAYDELFFAAIRTRLGPPDLALIPIGAYAPRWFMAAQHCDPTEAVQIHRELGAGLSLGMHWGTFQLTDEGVGEPPRELARALIAAELHADTFRVCAPGERVRL